MNDIDSSVNFLKNIIVRTDDDKKEVRIHMKKTLSVREAWYKDEAPSLTEITEAFPRYLDCEFLVSLVSSEFFKMK